jgi:hypothetical protein
MTRKEIAEIVINKPKNTQPIIFKMIDGKDYSYVVWKNIRPKYSKPFWQKEV